MKQKRHNSGKEAGMGGLHVTTAALLVGLLVPSCRAALGNWVQVQAASVFGTKTFTAPITGSSQQVIVPNARFVGSMTAWSLEHEP